MLAVMLRCLEGRGTEVSWGSGSTLKLMLELTASRTVSPDHQQRTRLTLVVRTKLHQSHQQAGRGLLHSHWPSAQLLASCPSQKTWSTLGVAEISELKYRPGGPGRWAVLPVASAEQGKAFSVPGETSQGWPHAAEGEPQGSLSFHGGNPRSNDSHWTDPATVHSNRRFL